MTRTQTPASVRRIASAATADRATAEAMLKEIAFVLEMTRRAKQLDTSDMEDRPAPRARRELAAV